jgi:hypothetical protein
MARRSDVEGTKEYQKEYRKRNKEKISKLNKDWHKANPNKNKEYKRKYRKKNKDILNAKERERYYKNIEHEKERAKIYRKNNPEKSNKRTRKWVKNNPEKAMFNRSKTRAKRRNIEFSIVLEDIVIPTECPILGIPLAVSSGHMTDNSPSLDRIDPSKGYVKGNVMVISNRANNIKGFGTAEEHIKIAEFMNNN